MIIISIGTAYLVMHASSIMDYVQELFSFFIAPLFGTVILAVNVVLLSCYTLGCHSIRHLTGGRKDALSKLGLSSACYNCSTALNYKHQLFAWCSLFTVAFCDVYIRLCSMGIWHDVRFF